MDTRETFQIKVLLDSGCTESCIDVEFVKKNNLVTKKLPRPLSEYNADGLINSGGPISKYIEVFMKVGCHQEKFQLAVSNIGKSEIFIDHDWLKVHNPMIDWQKGTFKFTCCPVECLPSTLAENPDDEESSSFLEEGERLLSVTFNGHQVWRSFITRKKHQ